MPISSARHIDFALQHAPDSRSVAYGAERGYGLLNQPGFDVTDSVGLRLKGPAYQLVVREGAFTGLTQDTTITIDGASYTVRDIGNAGTDGLRRLIVTKDG